jgi:hypothetical protein
VSWTAPTVLAQTPITDYVVQFKQSGGSWQTFTEGVSTATTATVTGLINGTEYTFRVAGVNGVGTGNYSAASSAVTPTAGDSLFSSVALLLHADAAGSSFVDSSPYSRTITASGDATQSATQSKWGGKSAAFDGNGDYLSATIPTLSGDFAIEMWFYATALGLASPGSRCSIIGTRTGSSGDAGFCLALADNATSPSGGVFFHTDSTAIVNASTTWSLNQWNHLAVSRSGSTVRIYLNGSVVGSGTFSGTFTETALRIGGEPRTATGANSNFTGYIDDFRLTVGSARSFTGSTVSVPTSPFPDQGIYSDPFMDKVSLLLHMDGSGSTFTDSSLTPKAVTVGGSATQSTSQSKFGGKSAKLASGDSLSVISSSVLTESSDYVLEFWLYPLSQSQDDRFFVVENGSGDSRGFIIDGGQFCWNRFGLPDKPLTGSLANNQWQYIALVKSGSTTSLYINGNRASSTTSSLFPSSPTRINWGASIANYAAAQINAYYDEVRITLGTDRGLSGSSIPVPSVAFTNS